MLGAFERASQVSGLRASHVAETSLRMYDVVGLGASCIDAIQVKVKKKKTGMSGEIHVACIDRKRKFGFISRDHVRQKIVTATSATFHSSLFSLFISPGFPVQVVTSQ